LQLFRDECRAARHPERRDRTGRCNQLLSLLASSPGASKRPRSMGCSRGLCSAAPKPELPKLSLFGRAAEQPVDSGVPTASDLAVHHISADDCGKDLRICDLRGWDLVEIV